MEAGARAAAEMAATEVAEAADEPRPMRGGKARQRVQSSGRRPRPGIQPSSQLLSRRLVSRRLARSLGTSLRLSTLGLVRRRLGLGVWIWRRRWPGNRGRRGNARIALGLGLLQLLQPLLGRAGGRRHLYQLLRSPSSWPRRPQPTAATDVAADAAGSLGCRGRDAEPGRQSTGRCSIPPAICSSAATINWLWRKPSAPWRECPNDTLMHEFRGLCLFAMNDYQQAAAATMPCCRSAPVWDKRDVKQSVCNPRRLRRTVACLEIYCNGKPRRIPRAIPVGISLHAGWKK